MEQGTEPFGEPRPRRLDATAHDVRIHVSALAVELARIRRAVVASAEAHGIAPRPRADIALAVSEACANVVSHAYLDAATPGPLTVETYREDDEFVVVVSDEGTGLAPRADSPGFGLGLALMARLAQRLEVGSNGFGGAKVTMAFPA
jgi:serine/threonine-protein kinase RsbW